jgi:polyhydroxyalkanoate synthesis regulator phasin
MPDKITNELLFEVLKSVQAQVALIREDVDSIKMRLTSIDTRLGLVHTDMANQSERLDRLESRMARVENRLSLSDA